RDLFITTNTASVFGTGTLTLNGGQITPNTVTVGNTISNAVNLNGFFQFSSNQNPGFTVFTGPVTLTGNAFLQANTGSGNGSVLFNGSIGGSGTLTVVGGASTVVLNNANT